MRHPALVLVAISLSACDHEPSGPTGAGVHYLARPDSVSPVETAVAKPPSILVLDAASKARSGVAVKFRVIAGGGSVSDSAATTDAAGQAILASWTLGPTATDNGLEIAVDGETPDTVVVAGQWARGLTATAQGACVIVNPKAWCWGDNSHREFGLSFGPTSALSPTSAMNAALATLIVNLAGGSGHHLCGINAEGFAACWGRNDFGQSGSYKYSSTGVTPGPIYGHAWTHMSLGRITSCAVDDKGDAYCWGANQRGEIGNPATRAGSNVPIEAPTQVIAPVKFKQVAAGWQHACALSSDGTAYCWGANLEGQLGIGVADSSHASATAVVTSEKFVRIAAGGRHTCALTADGRAFCWGINAYGQLGDSTTTSRLTPTAVAGGLRFTTIEIGTYFVSAIPPELSVAPTAGNAGHTCALTASGNAYCWGWNGWGQLGDGSIVDHSSPVAISGGQAFNGLALGEVSVCGMKAAGVWCWGGNAKGQIGNGTTARQLTATQVVLP